MAYFECDIWSAVLGRHTTIHAIVPQLAPFQPERRRGKVPAPRREYPALYLLHGLFENAAGWRRGCPLERLAADRKMVIVMPEGGRSFYTEMAHGENYWRFVADEVPEICRAILPVSGRREETFAAGISMGGYGALRLGLRAAERFSRVAAVSAFIDVKLHLTRRETYMTPEELADVFGAPEEQEARGNDLYALAEAAARSGDQAAIGLFCGTGDFMIDENRGFCRYLQEKLRWRELTASFTEGAHDWDYWAPLMPRVLDFFGA